MGVVSNAERLLYPVCGNKTRLKMRTSKACVSAGNRGREIYADGTKVPQQKSGFTTKKAASTDRDKTLGE